MNRGAVFGADDLEPAEQPMDDRVRDPDGHGGDDERKDDDTNGGVADVGHLSAGSIATKARKHETNIELFVFSRFRG
jgi:hypothetical protein